MFQFSISWFTQAALILSRVPQGTILVSCTNCCKKFNLGHPENISTSNPFILQPHTEVEPVLWRIHVQDVCLALEGMMSQRPGELRLNHSRFNFKTVY